MQTTNDLSRLFKNIAENGLVGDWRYADGDQYEANAPNNDTWPLLFLETPVFVKVDAELRRTYSFAWLALDRYSEAGDPHRNRADKIAEMEAASMAVIRLLAEVGACGGTSYAETIFPVEGVTVGPLNNDLVVGMRYDMSMFVAACEPLALKPGFSLCDYLTNRLDQ